MARGLFQYPFDQNVPQGVTVEIKLKMAPRYWTSAVELLRYLSENWPFDEADQFVAKEISPDARCTTTGDVALHFVAGWNDVRGIELLVNAGATIDVLGDMGCTPLASAVSSGSIDAVRLLLSLGASPDIRSEFGRSPAESAALEGSEEMKNAFRGAAI